MRNFTTWLNSFQKTNRTYSYWVDFLKVIDNADKYKIELHILNSLIGSKQIESDFEKLIQEYPKCLKCIPILLAVRKTEIEQVEGVFDFSCAEAFLKSPEKYVDFMKKTGLFRLIQNKLIKNLYDYVIGVEVGLDTNARKNRGGKLMSRIVSDYFESKKILFQAEVSTRIMEEKYKLDLSAITDRGTADKRFDFVVEKKQTILGIEVNFYSGGGSKLNETARSYKQIAIASKKIENFKFVWITDGDGWRSARHNLEETFNVLDDIYNINDLKSGEIDSLFL